MRKLVAFIQHVLSHDVGPFWQFIKYGTVGVMSTCVQVAVFYLLATTCLKCLTADDWAVKLLNFPAANISNSARTWRFALATGIGFVIANVFCWLMNRWFVFKPGKFRWYIEFAMFFGAATLATLIALGLSSALIHFVGLMTTAAVFIEVVASFLINYFTRKSFIFRG